MKYILVASKNVDAIQVLKSCFSSDYQIKNTDNQQSCIELFQKKRYEFLFIDVELMDCVGDKNEFKKQLQPFWSAFPEAEIIVLTSQKKIRQAVNIVKAGASNYLIYPIDPEEVKLITASIHRDQQIYSELKFLRSRFWRRESHAYLRTKSSAMEAVFDQVQKVSPTDTTILLTGETGTGKGVIANLIHRHSMRSEKQFIPVHCGAIPDTLLESELFGHEKGAFTSADRRKLGKFEIANHGTIFLDEIGTISASMQIKLLQVLQDRTYQRIGGENIMKTDVRVIVATNANLMQMCEDGTFRKDLFYRLNVFPIEIPPLRERKEDIPNLVEMFLERQNRFSLKKIRDVESKVIDALCDYHWPGNIRELENVIERAYVIESSSILRASSFPMEIFSEKVPIDLSSVNTSLTLDQARKEVIEQVEKTYLEELLQKNKGRIRQTAEAAGIGVRQLHKLMTKYKLRKEDFKNSLK